MSYAEFTASHGAVRDLDPLAKEWSDAARAAALQARRTNAHTGGGPSSNSGPTGGPRQRPSRRRQLVAGALAGAGAGILAYSAGKPLGQHAATFARNEQGLTAVHRERAERALDPTRPDAAEAGTALHDAMTSSNRQMRRTANRGFRQAKRTAFTSKVDTAWKPDRAGAVNATSRPAGTPRPVAGLARIR